MAGDISDLSNKMEPGTITREYRIPKDSCTIEIIASNSLGWDHLSLTVWTLDKFELLDSRLPSAEEMSEIKKMFFKDNEAVIEVHPKKEDYVNIAKNTLHLWRPNLIDLPVPPCIEDYTEVELIRVKPDRKLLIKRGEQDGWLSYRVSILLYGLPGKFKPTWYEMCIAKKALVGEDEIALQYHAKSSKEEKYSVTLWVPPKDIRLPLPEPFLVGARNKQESEAQIKKIMFSPHEYRFR